MHSPHVYAVIIGTEILNGRRQDAHFEFLKNALARLGHTLFASLVIKDDPKLIANTFTMVKNDPDAVLFSFGGIGSTPDDLTRSIASEVFKNSPLERHKGFESDILARFGEAAYPHRVHMADLPPHSTLLPNPVNNMSGFALENRYFFTPGFPNMAHPMIEYAITHYLLPAPKRTTLTLTASCSENTLIELMQALPSHIELSSLPQLIENKPRVVLSLSGENPQEIAHYFKSFTDFLTVKAIDYTLSDTF